MPSAEASADLLDRADRCFLGTTGPDGPSVLPVASWSDGQALWMSASTASLPTAVWDPDAEWVAYVPPVEAHEPGVIVHGRTRVYSLDEPLRLALHAPAISAAMAALATHHAGAVLGSLGEAARAPHRWLRRNRAVVRMVVHARREVDPPDVGRGVAPALPPVVPAPVRRGLAGLRRVVLVFDDRGDLRAAPAVWGPGFALRTPPTLRPAPGTPVVAAVDVEGRHPPRRPVGLALHGEVDPDSRLVPERVTSWCGPETVSAAVTGPVTGGVVMPD